MKYDPNRKLRSPDAPQPRPPIFDPPFPLASTPSPTSLEIHALLSEPLAEPREYIVPAHHFFNGQRMTARERAWRRVLVPMRYFRNGHLVPQEHRFMVVSTCRTVAYGIDR